MFRDIVFSAFGAALAICVGISVLQAFTTEPLILQAEEFERTTPHRHAVASETQAGWMAAQAREPVAQETGASRDQEEEAWGPGNGFERSFFTALANLVIGFGVSLMLLSLMVLKGGAIDVWSGLLWGVAGFFAVSLLPSLGLPPELPGTPAAEIGLRQAWWLAAAIATAAGAALVVFGRQGGWLALGALFIVAPHIFGAPEPPSHDVSYPGALAGEFVIASLVVSAVMWAIAGAGSAWFYQRLGART
jgi:cobalt transporter subunit CbtA